MGSSPERLEADIEQTREQLAETVAEIGEAVEARVDSAKQSVKPANLARNPKVRTAGGVLGGLFVLRALVRRRRRKRRERNED